MPRPGVASPAFVKNSRSRPERSGCEITRLVGTDFMISVKFKNRTQVFKNLEQK